jgi:hypothetical protein
MARAVVAAVLVLLPLTTRPVGAQAAAVPARTADSVRMTAITYLSGASVYVGAGRLDGVREGMSLEVIRSGSVIATVRILFLSSRSSAGEVASATLAPAVGDSVRYRPVAEPSAEAGADSTAAQPTRRASAQTLRGPIRGHIGLRYLQVVQPGIAGAGITQPSADLRLDGTRVGGTPLGFAIDARSRRMAGTRSSTSAARGDQTRVYEASLSFHHDGSGARVSVGRQYSAALSPVSLFDGVTVEVNRARWGAGGFHGFQPDQMAMGLSTDISELGGYFQLHSRPAEPFLWSVTTGAVGSREHGELNREFGFAQVVASARRLSLYATQEIDFNRGWKRAAGEPVLAPTSSFASMHVRVTDRFSVQGGVDNRRNVRLYRDYISPETEFDDAFRQGAWGGTNISLFRRLRIGADARSSRGGIAGAAEQYGGSLGVDPVTRLRVNSRIRSTHFRTNRTLGWLHAWSVAAEPFSFARVELNGGLRAQRTIGAAPDSAVVYARLPDAQWIGATIDVSIGRSWYAMLSATHDAAGLDRTRQFYGSLVYRF